MTDRLERALLAAQRRRAEDAPDPDRLRRALPGLVARRARARRAALAGGVVAALVAAGLAIRFGPVDDHPAVVPMVPPSSAAPRPAAPDMTRSYVPGWLPPGYHERQRAVSSTALTGGAVSVRTWSKAPSGSGRSFVRVIAQAGRQGLGNGTPVAVGKATGWYHAPGDGDPNAALTWPVDDEHAVMIQSDVLTAPADLVRVAVSVYPDTTPLRQPVVLGWAPFEIAEYTFSYGGNGRADWTAHLFVGASDPMEGLSIDVGASTDVPDGGKEVAVGRATGRLVVEEDPAGHNPRQCVVLPLPAGGRILTVCGGIAGPGGARLPEDQLLRAAASVDTTMRADTAWLG